jgi:hypothetical protein
MECQIDSLAKKVLYRFSGRSTSNVLPAGYQERAYDLQLEISRVGIDSSSLGFLAIDPGGG